MRTVALEFERTNNDGTKSLAAMGTDVIFHVDGRWKFETFYTAAHERAEQILAGMKHPNNLRFVGYTPLGTHTIAAPQLHRWH